MRVWFRWRYYVSRRAGASDRGAILLLALGFTVAASLIVLALASWATNDIKNTNTFVTVSQTQQDARSTANVAIGSIRYHPMLGTNQTLNQFSYCWGTSAPSSQSFQFTTEGVGATSVTHATITMDAYCSTVWNPQSSVSRVVTVDVCPSTTSTMAACTANPYLQAIVQFDDYPNNTTTARITGVCSTWCGQGMTITNWTWGSVGSTQLANTISVTSTPPNPAYVQGSAYVPVYSASGGTVVINSTTPSVCVVSSGYVEFLAAGQCTITFNDSGNANYLAATEVTQNITVSLNNPVRLTLSPSTPVTYTPASGFSTTLSTTGGSGSGAVSYSVLASSSASGCTVSGSTLTATSAGNCDILATKASDGVYAAVSVTSSITFVKATQSTLVITTPTTQSNDGSTITAQLATTGGSGTGAVTYSVSNGTASGCAVNSTTNTLSATSEGTCVVTATKASDADYLQTQSAPVTVTFQQGVGVTLAFTTPYAPNATLDQMTTTVTGYDPNGAPAGTVTVYATGQSGRVTVCTTSSKTSVGVVSTFICNLPTSLYVSTTYSNVYALYVPATGSPYAQATSASSTLTVTGTGTVATLAPMMVHGPFNQQLVGLLYGHENLAQFAVSVTSANGTPATQGDKVTITLSQKNTTTCTATLDAQGRGYCTILKDAVSASSNGATLTISASFPGDANLNAASSNIVTIPLYTKNPDSISEPTYYAGNPNDPNNVNYPYSGYFTGSTSSNGLDDGKTVTVTYCANYYRGGCSNQNNAPSTLSATDSSGSWITGYSNLFWEPYPTSEAYASEPDYYSGTITSTVNTKF